MNIFRSNLIIALCAVILGSVFNYLFFEQIPGISFFLFMVLGFILFYSLHRYFGRSYRPLVTLTLLILFFALMVGIRSSLLLTFLNIALVFYLVLVLVREAKGQRSWLFGIKDYITTAITPIWHTVVNSLRTLGELLSLQGVIDRKQSTSMVLKGILMAIPFLVIFIALFASADLVFREFITNLVSFEAPEEFFAQMFIVAFVSLGSLGGLAYIFTNSGNTTAIEGETKVEGQNRVSVLQISVFLGAIVTLFLIFIGFQFRYFFGGDNIVQQSFTYAEYAHRGFGELIAVALLSLVIIMATERYVHRRNEAHALPFKILSMLLVAEVIVLMVSAFKRLHIYQEAYGFTNLRLYVSAFIVWLSIMFIMFAYKIWRHKRDQFFARTIFVGVIAFIAAMNVINPEAIIVKQNIKHYREVGRIDLPYLHNLSYDAVPHMLPLLNDADEKVRRGVGHSLYTTWEHLKNNEKDWQEFNVSRARTRALLNERATQLNQYKDDIDYLYGPYPPLQ